MSTQNSFMFYSNFLDAINQLPENERANACYKFCNYALTGNLPEDKSLAMFCIGVSCSVRKYQNRGGNHNPTGRNQYSGQSGQTGQSGQNGQKAIQTQTKTETKNNIYNNIINNIGKENTNSILIDSNFSCSKFDVFKVYIQNMPAEIIKSVESWIKKEKNGQTVPVEFITKQFINFANRQNKPLFKGEQQCK